MGMLVQATALQATPEAIPTWYTTSGIHILP